MRTGEPSEAVQSEIDDAGRVRYYRIYTYPIFDDERRLVNLIFVSGFSTAWARKKVAASVATLRLSPRSRA